MTKFDSCLLRSLFQKVIRIQCLDGQGLAGGDADAVFDHQGGEAGAGVIVKCGVWSQAAFLSDSSCICIPSLNFTLFTTNVSSANPLSRFQFFWADSSSL